jgi:hypothetical protein
MDQREELAALRRLAELEAKSGGGTGQVSTAKVPQRRGVVDNVTGALATLNRNLIIGDEMAAAGGMLTRTARDAMAGKAGRNPLEFLQNAGRNYGAALDQQNAMEDAFAAEHPYGAAVARTAGQGASMFVPGGAALNATRGLNMARGAVSAALPAAGMALMDRGTIQERLSNANKAAAVGGLFGGTMGAIAKPAATAAKQLKVQAKTDSDILKAIGVQPSIPQQIGGLAKNVEDLAMRAPVIGSAIAGSRQRQLEQLNRGVGLTALQPIGQSLPKGIKAGFEMVDHVDNEIGKVYQQATDMVPSVNVDQAFVNDLQTISQRKGDLPTSVAEQFDRIMHDRLMRLGSGQASGQTIKGIHSELGKLQSEAAKKGEMTLSEMLGETRRAVMGIVERANPAAGDLIKQADAAWAPYSIMNDAAAAASAKGGVFNANQLQTQVRSAGKRLGSNMTGKGKAPLQDIATAASRTLPDQFGNPGTANAVALGGLGVGAMTSPVQTAAVAGGLVAGATPYWLSARKIIETLPPNATVPQQRLALQQLQVLAQKDPKVAQLANNLAANIGLMASRVPAQ